MSDKFLFISDPWYPDYMSDAIFHGIRSILNENLIDAKKINFMYKDYPNLKSLYGRGFTLYGKLENLEIDRENIEEKIKNRYFKGIIYGSCLRKLEYLGIVKENYKKEEVIFIDGEDQPVINYDLINYGLYFKRELQKEIEGVHPIQFAIPEESIIKYKPEKVQYFGTVIPYNLKTYVFNSEENYYEDYARSYFGMTCKKQGWDCLRHYEIMMNYCFPYFKDLESCPPLTMFRMPKKLIIKAMEELHSNIFDYYEDFMDELMFDLTHKLTTKKMAQYLLEFIP